MSELIKNAQSIVDKIYINMTKVETCEAISEEIATLPIAFVKDNDKYISLEGVLTDQQIDRIKEDVIKQINFNKTEAETFLQSISTFEPSKQHIIYSDPEKRKPATINQDFEDAVQEMIVSRETADKKREEVKPKKSIKVELDYDEIKKMYIDDNMTLQEIAEIKGCGRTSIYNFCNTNGLKKPKKADLGYKDGDKIYATPSRG